LLANAIPRYPEIKNALSLTYLDFGAATAAFPVGAIALGLVAGMGIRRFGSARVAVLGTILLSIGMVFVGLAPSWIFLAAALFLAGAMDTITDVAQNAQGLRVQKVYGTSILNSFHAGWSVGAVIGGAMGAAAVALNIPIAIHLGFSGLLFTTVSLLAYRFMLHGPETTLVPQREPEPTVVIGTPGMEAVTVPTGPAVIGAKARLLTSTKWVPLGLLALMAIGGMIVEDGGITWSTFYLTNDLEAPTAVVGFGLIAFLSGHFLARLFGDSLVNRWGQRAVTRLSALTLLIGMGTSLAFPSVLGSIVGFAAAGIGIATLIPAAMAAANELPGFRAGTGLTLVTWLMRIGAFSSPLIVGAVADQFGLRVGLLLMPLVGLIVLVLSPVFAKRP